jgi:hypothetical protein
MHASGLRPDRAGQKAPLTPAAARNAFIAVVGATIAKETGRFQP